MGESCCDQDRSKNIQSLHSTGALGDFLLSGSKIAELEKSVSPHLSLALEYLLLSRP